MVHFLTPKTLAGIFNPFDDSAAFTRSTPQMKLPVASSAATKIADAAVNVPANAKADAVKVQEAPRPGFFERNFLQPFRDLPENERRWLIVTGELHPATMHPPFRDRPSAPRDSAGSGSGQ